MADLSLSLFFYLQPDSLPGLGQHLAPLTWTVWALPFIRDLFFRCDIKPQDTPEPAPLRACRNQNMIFRLFPRRGETKKQSTSSPRKVWPTDQRPRGHRGFCYKCRTQAPPQTDASGRAFEQETQGMCLYVQGWEILPLIVVPAFPCTSQSPDVKASRGAPPGVFKWNINLHSWSYKEHFPLTTKFLQPPMWA